MRKRLPIYYSTESESSSRPWRLIYLLVISVSIHMSIIWLIDYPPTGHQTSATNPIRIRFRTPTPVEISTKTQTTIPKQIVKPTQAVKPPVKATTVPDKPRLSAVQLISHSLEEARYFEEKSLPAFGEIAKDKRVIETKTEIPLSIFSRPSEERQSQRPDGNTWIKIASIFGGYQCFIVRPADPLNSFDHGAWYMVRC